MNFKKPSILIYLVRPAFITCLLGCSLITLAQTAADLSIDDIRLTWSSASQTANSHGQPFVADLDNDGVPEVVVTNSENGTLNILDGVGDGAGFSDYDAISKTSPGAIDLGFKPFNTVAIASLDLEVFLEIVSAL